MEQEVKDLYTKSFKIIETGLSYYFPSVKGFSDIVEKEIEKGTIDDSIKILIEEYKLDQPNPTYSLIKEIIQFLSPDESNIKILQEENNDNKILEECSICMENMANSETSCKHWICENCWKKIMENKKDEFSCPFCRQKVKHIRIINN